LFAVLRVRYSHDGIGVAEVTAYETNGSRYGNNVNTRPAVPPAAVTAQQQPIPNRNPAVNQQSKLIYQPRSQNNNNQQVVSMTPSFLFLLVS
jgi:hypothetical protein